MYLWICFLFPVWAKRTPSGPLEAKGQTFFCLSCHNPDWFTFTEFWLFLIFGHNVKCVKLTAVFLIGPVVALRLAVTDPAFWYTLVCGSATVELWILTGFCTCRQKQKGWAICTDRDKTCDYSCETTMIHPWKLLLDRWDKIRAVTALHQ